MRPGHRYRGGKFCRGGINCRDAEPFGLRKTANLLGFPDGTGFADQRRGRLAA
jgi:hypothetical protein